MAVPIEPSGAPVEHRLQRLTQEQQEKEDARTAVWGFIWTLFCFKIATVVLIIYAAMASSESIWLLITTTWYWMIIPAVAIIGPLAYQIRVRRVRRKRAQLQREEWHPGDQPSGPADTVTIITGPRDRHHGSSPGHD